MIKESPGTSLETSLQVDTDAQRSLSCAFSVGTCACCPIQSSVVREGSVWALLQVCHVAGAVELPVALVTQHQLIFSYSLNCQDSQDPFQPSSWSFLSCISTNRKHVLPSQAPPTCWPRNLTSLCAFFPTLWCSIFLEHTPCQELRSEDLIWWSYLTFPLLGFLHLYNELDNIYCLGCNEATHVHVVDITSEIQFNKHQFLSFLPVSLGPRESVDNVWCIEVRPTVGTTGNLLTVYMVFLWKK